MAEFKQPGPGGPATVIPIRRTSQRRNLDSGKRLEVEIAAVPSICEDVDKPPQSLSLKFLHLKDEIHHPPLALVGICRCGNVCEKEV